MSSTKSDEEKETKEKPIIVRNTTDLQRLKLEKLMKNPDKPILIPERPKERGMPAVPDFVRNVMGSSAGAGSGEFHVYRHLRRKEYARQKYLKESAERERLEEEYHKKLQDYQKKAEEETAKRRAKRLKKKQKQQNKKKLKPNKTSSASEDVSEATEESCEEEDEENRKHSDLDTSENSVEYAVSNKNTKTEEVKDVEDKKEEQENIENEETKKSEKDVCEKQVNVEECQEEAGKTEQDT